MHFGSDSLVIIPTYNECENIEKIIRAVFALEHDFHILVVEDNSPDGTAAIVKRMQEEFPERLYMIERTGKLGLGTAYIAGFKWALEQDYDYIFEMDADFSHNPLDLPRLYNACAKEGADVAIGSRYVTGVNVVDWPMSRILMSYGAFKVCQTDYRYPCARHNGRIRLLPQGSIADDRARQYPFQRLCLPDRDEIHCLATGVPRQGSTRHFRQPQRRNFQDEH